MRSSLLMFFLLISVCVVRSQDLIQEKFNNAYALSQQKNYRQALAEYKSIIDQIPAHSPARLQASWCYLILGEVAESARQADLAVMMDPFYQAVYSMKAYVSYAQGDPKAEQFLRLAIWMSSDDSILQYFQKDYDDLVEAGVQPQVFRALKNKTAKLFDERNKSFGPVITDISKGQQLLAEGNGGGAVSAFQNAIRMALFPSEFSHFRPL
ncbi:MAG TPA: tetratricopeptide repeat protein, partial [Chryseosolibacter sp.]|nr:tetratricopeptide repeat protein [Chryseosolibacter sp.]